VDEISARIASKESSELAPLAILAEVGNIAVSAAANALAQMLGETSLPSVPRAGYSPGAELQLPELVEVFDTTRVVADVVLYERHGPLRFHFVLVPVLADID
jgi:chemotaxis protein CheY-P-specific phosphatase CheC